MESLQISILTPLPGTPLFDQMRPNLLLNDFPRDWDFFDGAHCVYDHSRLGIEGTQEAIFNAHRRFYRACSMNPRIIRHLGPRPMTFIDKLRDMWWGVKCARETMSNWRTEIGQYLSVVRQRRTRLQKDDVPKPMELMAK